MTLRLTDEQEQALELLAEEGGVSRPRPRRFSTPRYARVRERDVKNLSAAARERYSDVLDRLGR